MSSIWGFALSGEGTDTLELDVYDTIGESQYSEGVTARDILHRLSGSFRAKTIHTRINSAGGDVMEGFAIYNLLTGYGARIEIDIDGLAASMASVIAAAGDEVRMAENALFMIHNPAAKLFGEAGDLRRMADVLDKIRDNIASVYVTRSKQPRESVLAAMDAETWLTAAEAKALGYVDRITSPKKIEARWDLSSFERVPETLGRARRALGSAQLSTIRSVPRSTRSDSPREKSSMRNAIRALGLSDDAEESAVVSAIVATKDRLATAESALREYEALTGKVGREAVATVAAYRQSHEAMPALRAELEGIRTKQAVEDRSRLIEGALARGVLTAGMRPWAEKVDVDTLKEFIAVAQPVVPGKGPERQPTEPENDGAALSAGDLRHARELGMKPDEYLAAKRTASGGRRAA